MILQKKIIFDFDGVLVASLPNLYAINSAAAIVLGKMLTKEQYLSAFIGSLNKNLSVTLSLSDEELAQFIEHKRKIFSDYYNGDSVLLFPFAADLIKQASLYGELSILSTAPEEHVRAVLEENELVDYFTHIIGQSQQPKSVFLSEGSNDSTKTFFITDTVGDLLEANLVDSITSIAVTWGFHEEEILKTGNPSLVARKPEDVINYLCN